MYVFLLVYIGLVEREIGPHSLIPEWNICLTDFFTVPRDPEPLLSKHASVRYPNKDTARVRAQPLRGSITDRRCLDLSKQR